MNTAIGRQTALGWDPFGYEDEYVIGADASSFVPYLGMVGKMVGGLLGGGSSDASAAGGGSMQQLMAMQMMQQERDRKAAEAAAAKSRQTMMLVGLGVVGLLGVGALVYLLKK